MMEWTIESADALAAQGVRRDCIHSLEASAGPTSDRDAANLIISELLANAVEHGHSENGTFTVHCEYRAGAMNVEIRDYYTGEPWSGGEKTQRRGGQKNAGGLGLILMDYLMDSGELLKAQNGGTCVRLRKLSDRSSSG